MFSYYDEELFKEDVLTPLRRQIAIRYMEFPGDRGPVVFVRLATIARLAGKPVFCRLKCPIIEHQSTRSWGVDFTYFPHDNWEAAGEMLCEGEDWEEMHRAWETAQYDLPECDREWLVQACRADQPFAANPMMIERPRKIEPINLTDEMFMRKMYAVLHMIPCHLETGGYYTHGKDKKVDMIEKLEERLSGYLRKANKT